MRHRPETFHPAETSHQQDSVEFPEIAWLGESSLMERVVYLLENDYSVRLRHSENRIPNVIPGTLIHEGNDPLSVPSNFAMDYNIHDYGLCPDTIAENLWQRITTALV